MGEFAHSMDSIKSMAQKIHFVSFDVIKFQDHEMRSHWYKHEYIDLYYFQTHTGRIAKIHISLFGQVLEWNPLDGIRTGLLIEEEKEGEVFETIQYDPRPNDESISQSLLVLDNALNIEVAQRQKLIQCLTIPTDWWTQFKKNIKRAFSKK